MKKKFLNIQNIPNIPNFECKTKKFKQLNLKLVK